MKNKSIIFKLRQEGKSNPQFEFNVNRLTLEELILLKLELSAKYIFNKKFYLFSLWDSLNHIIKEAAFKFAEITCEDDNQARILLGMRWKNYKRNKKIYGFDTVEEED